MEIKRYCSEDETVWDNFISSSKNGLFQFVRKYMDYHSDRFCDHSLLFFDDKELIAVLPLSEHGDELISHGGLTFGGMITNTNMKQYKMNAAFDELEKYMRENGFKRIVYKVIPNMYHMLPSEEDVYSLFCKNASIIKIESATVCDLTKPIKMPKGRKAQISRAKREGVVIEESMDFDSFIELENEVLNEHHGAKAVHSGAELTLLKKNFPDNIKLFVAKYENEMIAGAVLYIYPDVVHTQYLGANETARKIGALDYTISYVMNLYKDEKKWFDFGKSTEGDGKILNEGLIAQKEGFGGRTKIYQTWELKI